MLIGSLVMILSLVIVMYGWALFSLNGSAMARALVWGSADVTDLHRFPERHVHSGGEFAPFRDAMQQSVDVSSVTVPGGNHLTNLDQFLRDTGTSAFLIARADQLLYERYFGDQQPDSPHTSFSVAKSVLSSLVGIAIGEGAIGSVDDTITTYIPELSDRDPRFASIRVAHLISMTSGLEYEEEGLPWSDDTMTYYAPDLRALALEKSIVGSEPGSEFHYNNYNPLLLGILLERATGQTVADYMESRLWSRMGAEFDASWSLDSDLSGFEKMESGVNARARDYVRFGMLYAMEGRSLVGKAVVPSEWVDKSTAVQTSTNDSNHSDDGYLPYADYGYFWWVLRGSHRFYAAGNHGQFVFVDPIIDLVIVRLGHGFGTEDWPLILDQIASISADE